MLSVLAIIVSMIGIEYSIPLAGILTLMINISGGDIMNIISITKGNVADRGVYGVYYLRRCLIEAKMLKLHHICDLSCRHR